MCPNWCSLKALAERTWRSGSWNVVLPAVSGGIVKHNIMHARAVVGENIEISAKSTWDPDLSNQRRNLTLTHLDQQQMLNNYVYETSCFRLVVGGVCSN